MKPRGARSRSAPPEQKHRGCSRRIRPSVSQSKRSEVESTGAGGSSSVRSPEMRIALATDWFPPRRGGIESQLMQLAPGLSHGGHDVHVLTSTPGSELANGFPGHRPPGPVPFIDAALSPVMLAGLCRELQADYDVVHSHVSVVSPLAYAAAVRAHAQGTPGIVTFHSILRFKRHLLRVMNDVFGFAANGTVWTAVSDLVAAQLRSAIDSDVIVLPNGI